MLIDKQRNKLYKWERSNILSKDNSVVKFSDIQNIVNYIWQNEGLSYPPVVKSISKNCKKILACASRLEMFFPTSVSTAVILHELAHSMTSDCEGYSNAHGALFVGVYCQLASKYLKLDLDKLISSAIIHGLRVERNPKLEIF